MESTHCELPPNPREKTNFLSVMFFTWTFPMFKKGYQKVLGFDDIFQTLKSDKSNTLGDRLEV